MFHLHRINRVAQQLIKHKTRGIGYFVTTPIFYVNSAPHIGHVQTLLLADAVNIYQRLKLETVDTILSTGTDEHGIKIQMAAEAAKMECQKFCDLNANKFLELFREYDTTLTDFIRTTEHRHTESVQSIWNELNDKGFIYKSTYSGWYCCSDEVFVPESQIQEKQLDGKTCYFDSNDNQLIWSQEENYMFRLSAVINDVDSWLAQKKPIIPEKFNDEALDLLKRLEIGDISISRPKSRLEWGISVPGDPSQTIYVWLDALSNYLTVSGYPCAKDKLKRWPIDCQIFGKDILKFHAIYWPAFLIALDLPLPRKLFCHSHWLVDNMKMSKSRGNVVDPKRENQLLTTEGTRYYLLRASTPHADNDYNHAQAIRRINSELADTYGNLISRCCSKTINPNQSIPTCFVRQSHDSENLTKFIDQLNELKAKCEIHYENGNFYNAVDQIMSVLRLNNGLYEDAKPWKLVKLIDSDRESLDKYTNIQAITFECLRICSILLQPMIPKLSSAALERLDVSQRFLSAAKTSFNYINSGDSSSHRPLGTNSSVLFQRLQEQK